MIIETHNLCKTYGKVRTLKNINLQVPEGAAFALVGTNGAGKTIKQHSFCTFGYPSIASKTT
jgi:ABC-2 type transport system ATP-binding protein